ncbi:MAG TPA: UDP-N-acetylmuramoyl-L-alanyl-D-glutamate--2,6-diaminopimelate ligase [Longimicrobiaceae bacterium]|nr:UDP-N-acetylmuramoyl-L-alanyl-D-glutamate--2,6-diaminopimelate ligase [Longimicrobiaceae bacterium]
MSEARTVPLARMAERLEREGLLRGSVPPLDLPVRGVAVDSRKVGKDFLFCAVTGTQGDGHRFLPDAAERGAAAALVEHPDPSLALPQVTVVNGRLAAAHAAAAFHGDPWGELTLVGVTGTNGKTTTAAIFRHLLARRGPAASIGTLGAVGPDGRTIPGTEGLTTPGPVETAEWLRRLADSGVRGVAMEVSSHALDQGRVAAARFDAAVFTNLTRDHLDYHGTMEAYGAAKLRLLELLKPGGVAALNADDPAWDAATAPGGRMVRFGIRNPAEVRAEGVSAAPGGMAWTLRTPDGAYRVRLPLFGDYNVANALGVAAALWGLGWPMEEIAAGLELLPQVPGRLERVPAPGVPGTVLIDYAHTPDALRTALRALRPLTPGRLIVVFGAGGDRDRGKRPEMGRVAAALADLVIVTSDNPRSEDPGRIADDIERGMGDAPRVRLLDRREAIRCALDEAGQGDVVLLAGKGHETYQVWGSEVRPFDERAVIQELLAERETISGRGAD